MRAVTAIWCSLSLLSLPQRPLSGQTLAELTAQLAGAETVDGSMVGDDGHESDTWRAYEKWRGLATVAELRELTKHTSPVVRAYAVRALVEIEAPVDFAAIAAERLMDVAKVTTFEGCCRAEQFVGDVILATMRPRLSPEQILDLAEALIGKHSPLHAREWSLRTLRLRDGMLHTVRTMAANGDAVAGIALARYALPVDAKVLAKLLQTEAPFDDNAWFIAAEVHRDPSLLAPLVAIEGKARSRMATDNPSRLTSWLQAIAAQQSPEASAFLLRFLQGNRLADGFKEKDLLNTYKQALVAYPQCSAFDAVRTELKQRIAASRR